MHHVTHLNQSKWKLLEGHVVKCGVNSEVKCAGPNRQLFDPFMQCTQTKSQIKSHSTGMETIYMMLYEEILKIQLIQSQHNWLYIHLGATTTIL